MNILLSSAISGTIGYFVKRGWDNILSEDEYRDELNHIISKTIEEYAAIRPVKGIHETFPFYQSQAIIDELVKLGIADKSEDSDKKIEEELAKNEHVIPPKPGDLRLFLDLFYANCTKNEKIQQLHIEKFYKEEVFIISQKIDRLQSSVDAIAGMMGEGLKAEWKRQINVYKDEIAQCKPKTALELLEKLDESIKESETEVNDNVKARIHHLKALCYEMMRNRKYVDEYHQCYVLEPTNVQYQALEAVRLLHKGDCDNATALAERIKKCDDDNPVAAFVLCYDNDKDVFSEKLRKLPLYIQRSTELLSKVFQYIVKDNVISLSDPLIQYLIDNYIQKTDVSDHFSYFIENYRRLEYVQFVFLMTTHQYFFDRRMTATPMMAEIASLASVLTKRMAGSEIEKLFSEVYFLDCLSGYIVNDDREKLVKAIDYCDKKKVNFCLMLAACLQYEGYNDEAIQVADMIVVDTNQVHFLKMFIYSKTQNKQKALEEYGRYIHSLKNVSEIDFPKVFSGIVNKMLYPEEGNLIDLKGLSEKSFENDKHRKIIVDLTVCIDKKDEESFGQLCKDVGGEEEGLRAAVAMVTLLSGYYQLALPIYEGVVKRGIYDDRMFYYLQALHLSKTRNALLLELLKDWREHADHQEAKLLEIELRLRTMLREWEESLKVIKLLYEMMPLTEDLYSSYLVILLHNEKKDEIAALKDLAPSVQFKHEEYIMEVASVLNEVGFLVDAMNFLLPFAKNPDRPRLRMQYLGLCHSTNEGDTILKMYDEVKEGAYVYYLLNGVEQKQPLYIKPDSNSRIIQSLIGHRPGETVQVLKEFGTLFDKVEIKEIANDHYVLMKEIYTEMENPISSNLPTTMFQLPENHDVESLNGFFIQNFGPQEEEKRRNFKEILTKYDRGEVPYGMMPVLLYGGDFIRGYYILCSNQHGILLNPQCLEEQVVESDGMEYVLDYSSLMLFYELSRTEGMIFKHHYVVSKVVEEIAQRELEKLEKSPDNSMSLEITLDGVTPIFHTKESKQWQKDLIKGLLGWIRNNCTVETAEGRLDLLMRHDIKQNLGEGFGMDYVADYMKLIENKNRILVSDDRLLQQLYLPRKQGVSSYTYLNYYYHSNDIVRKMLQMNYIGVPVDADFVFVEFSKKQKGEASVYDQTLKSWGYLESVNRQFVIQELCSLVKKIYLTPVVSTDVHREVQKVFVTVMQGVSDVSTYMMLQKRLNKEFALLGYKLPMVLKDLLSAVNIIGTGKGNVIL